MTEPVRACPTGKIAYPSRGSANSALSLMPDDPAKRRERRAYRCPVCWQFHTTSKPRRRTRRADAAA